MNNNQETKKEDNKTSEKTDEKKDNNSETKKDEEVFVKKEDETSFKLVDKTTDEEKPSTTLTEESKKLAKEKEALAISVAKNEWFGGEEPEDSKVYFTTIKEKTDNIFVIGVWDKETTRLKTQYEINVLKKEIVTSY